MAEGELDIPALPLAARRDHIVPALTTASLLSMGQLCDSGRQQVTFDASSVRVILHDQLIMAGAHTPATGLWHQSLVTPSSPDEIAMPLPAASSLLHHSFAAVISARPAKIRNLQNPNHKPCQFQHQLNATPIVFHLAIPRMDAPTIVSPRSSNPPADKFTRTKPAVLLLLQARATITYSCSTINIATASLLTHSAAALGRAY